MTTQKKLLFVLDPSIIQSSSTKIALIKKLLALTYTDHDVDQYNINLIYVRARQNNITYNHYDLVYYLNSSNFATILQHLLAVHQATSSSTSNNNNNNNNIPQQQQSSLPEEVVSLVQDYQHEEGNSNYEFSEDTLKMIYKLMISDGKFFVRNELLNLTAIMNGFLIDGDFWIKPNTSVVGAVPLSKPVSLNKTNKVSINNNNNSNSSSSGGLKKLPKFKKAAAASAAPTQHKAEVKVADLNSNLQSKLKFFDNNTFNDNSSIESDDSPSPKSLNNYDDIDEASENGLINEHDLLGNALPEPLKLTSMKCVFDENGAPVKRRKKACKNCTCGLREMEEQEIEQRDANLKEQQKDAVKFSSEEVTEIDFTVEGEKIGGCGSCALGDAFRCDGCPYLGLPPFKPGEAISIGAMGDDF